MIEQVEKQFIPQQEIITPQGVEIEQGGSAVLTDLNNQTSSQPVLGQSPSVIVSPEFEAPEPVSPDSNETTGDKWNNAIKSKELGVAPTVL